MTEPEEVKPVLQWTVGINSDVRRFYRKLRQELGLGRLHADNLTAGYVLGSGQGHVLLKVIDFDEYERLGSRAGC